MLSSEAVLPASVFTQLQLAWKSPVRVLPQAQGRVIRQIGLTLEAAGLQVAMGDYCRVAISPQHSVVVEVIGFSCDRVSLMPLERIDGLPIGARVWPAPDVAQQIPVGEGLLGRVIDGLARPLDGKGALDVQEHIRFVGPIINPLHRKPIRETLDVGIRAINGLLTVGRGQRIGLFAGSGVGKSVLMGMMTKFTEADIVVVGLIGERGREVREFIEDILGEEGLKRAVVVASPADDVPLMRLRASWLATRIAEYYRDQGKSVLLLMDSLTRFAQAQREIALAAGEPPATRGYPPSVFAKLPDLVERAGNGHDKNTSCGSITAFYTVLTEGDDLQDPVADAARAILDGHIVLSRRLAEEGIYPAIDIEASISRAMPAVVSEEHMAQTQRFKKIYACYQQNSDLINIGAYTAGSSADIDTAIECMPLLKNYVTQHRLEPVSATVAREQLQKVLPKKMLS
jgi:flagellum-specific ATP synthase